MYCITVQITIAVNQKENKQDKSTYRSSRLAAQATLRGVLSPNQIHTTGTGTEDSRRPQEEVIQTLAKLCKALHRRRKTNAHFSVFQALYFRVSEAFVSAQKHTGLGYFTLGHCYWETDAAPPPLPTRLTMSSIFHFRWLTWSNHCTFYLNPNI